MSAIPLSTLATSRRWQTNFLKVLPAVKEHAAVSFRRLSPEAKAEATAEAVASACVSYAKLARQKKLARVYPSSIATFAVKAVNGNRHVGGHQSCRDVMSPLTQKRRGFTVGSLTAWCPPEGPWQEVVVDSRRVSPADRAAFKLDFAQWLSQWPLRHRRIINSLAAGHRTMAVALRFGVSPARVSQLRREFERSWQQFQGMALADAA